MLLKGTGHIVRAEVPGRSQDIITVQDRIVATAAQALEAAPTGEAQPHLRAGAPIEPGNLEEVPVIQGLLLHRIAVQVTADLPGPAVREVRATGVPAEVHQEAQGTGVLEVVPEVLVVSGVPVAVHSDHPVVEDLVAEAVPEVEEADNNFINRHL